ncbi:hypothetical protein BDB00DRAFT_795639, partial [Zychaea mexicana]|uniref:uncharacterized protein n=1 Tax=Zychaea mexicana TaxID=64656 RepID=UPI0022FDC4A2
MPCLLVWSGLPWWGSHEEPGATVNRVRLSGLDYRQSTVWQSTVWRSTLWHSSLWHSSLWHTSLGIRLSAFDSRHSTLGIRLSAFDSRHSTLGNRHSAISSQLQCSAPSIRVSS